MSSKHADANAEPPADTQTPEVSVSTDWSRHLETAGAEPTATSSSLSDVGEFADAHDVHNILSAEECRRLVTAAEAEGFGFTNYPKHYRGNLRLIAVDPGLAARLWARMAHTVPATHLDGQRGLRTPSWFPEGTTNDAEHEWVPTGLNTHWRLSKYYPGNQFQRHVDAAYHHDDTHRTMYTVNIYLNGGFDGGATRFYENRFSHGIAHSITPAPGRAVVFRQPPEAHLHHDGEELGNGIKYLLRSDVMYERRTKAVI